MPTPVTTPTAVSRNQIIIPRGVTEPPFTDTITKAGQSVLPNELSKVKFFMRPLLSRIPSINGVTAEKLEPPDEEHHNVQYKWAEVDVSNEGEFMVWWGFNLSGAEYETPEFPITISDHGPGTGVETGAIFDGVADHMPNTFNGLRNDPHFGERRIQKIVTLIQLRVLKSYVPPDQELTAYELPLLDYFSKRVALELCTPGIDYWGRQHKTINAVSPTEMASFPDMIAALEKLRDKLVCELEENWRELQYFVPELKQRRAEPMPGSSLEFFERPEPNGKLTRRETIQGYVTRDPGTTAPLQTGQYGIPGFYPSLNFFPNFP